jgi:hypothetical protein
VASPGLNVSRAACRVAQIGRIGFELSWTRHFDTPSFGSRFYSSAIGARWGEGSIRLPLFDVKGLGKWNRERQQSHFGFAWSSGGCRHSSIFPMQIYVYCRANSPDIRSTDSIYAGRSASPGKKAASLGVILPCRRRIRITCTEINSGVAAQFHVIPNQSATY